MVSPHGIKLAAHLVSSLYGDLCSKVCECLLQRGALSLALIIRFTELSKENAINCLRVLIHQNCVQAFATVQEGQEKIVTNYMALFDNVIHKMRAPKFMHIVKDELGDHCLDIFQGLIQHGRLSFNQIVDRSEQTTGHAGGSDAHAVRECFSKLLAACFIERCPAPEPLLSPPAEVEAPAKKYKSGKPLEQTIEQRVLEAAAPMQSRRFLMEFDDESTTAKESTDIAIIGKKRKKDVMRSGDDVLDADKDKEVLWRVNFEELVCCLKQKACISNVEKRINAEAGIVLGAILELGRRSGGARQKAGTSASLSINAIYDEVIKKEGGLSMDFERIRTALEQLGCETSPSDIDENYSMDIKSIIEIAQNGEVESLVLRRYGREAYRIFRLLSTTGRFIDTKKISDTTFVEKKDTAKILFRLWKDEYLHMEKAWLSGAKEYQPALMLWKVSKGPLHKQILDEMYHAALNLRLRIAHEQDQGKEVSQLPLHKLSGEMKKKVKLLAKVRVILESSLLNLDDAILLFHDF